MAGVQFCGAQSVVDAFQLGKAACWAVVYNKEVMYAGSSPGDLHAYLDSLSRGGSKASYTLRMYREDLDPDEIERDTPYTRCFNFTLNDGLYQGGAMGGVGTADPILKGIQDHLYKKVAAAVQAELNGDNEEEEDDSVGGLLKGLLREPDKLAAILDKVPGVLSSIRGFMSGNAMGMPVNLAGTEPKRAGTVGQPAQPTQDDVNRLQAALDILGKCDPDIISNLEKLAALARDKPGIYKMAVAQLNSL